MEVHSRNEQASKLNNFFVGVGIALLIPALAFILYWYVKYYPSYGLGEFMKTIGFEYSVSHFAVCALPDPLVFYFFSKRRYDNACKGMLVVIAVLLVMTLVMKIF